MTQDKCWPQGPPAQPPLHLLKYQVVSGLAKSISWVLMGGSKPLAALERRGTCGAPSAGWMGGEGMTEAVSGLEGHTVSFPWENLCPSFPLGA